MKIDLKKVAGSTGAIFGFLALFGISGGFVTGNIQDMWRAPARIDAFENEIRSQKHRADSLQERLDHAYDFMEMNFQFCRLMTDKTDPDDWFVVTEGGAKYRVGVRQNNEKVLLAFVFGMNIVYPIYKDPSDNDRYYIIIHDHKHGTNQNLLLYKD